MVDAIRYSIERGDFQRANALWEEWSRDLCCRIAAGRVDEAEWKRVAQFYRWSKDVLLCARAGLIDQLNTLHAVEAYGAQRMLS
jgi:hypothetical protein